MAVPTPSKARTTAWIGLTLLGLFFLFAPLMDIIGTHAHGLPTDHSSTFTNLTGTEFAHAQATAHGTARYISTLEYGYALHELTFGLLFMAVVIFAFRRGQRWAWFACWAVLIAAIGYSATFGAHDSTLLSRSLIADVALPVLLVVAAPSFFQHRKTTQPPTTGDA
ncbi:hypothetical protein ACWEO4_45085 [Streptomyces sp. NPDC004393]